MLINHIWNSTSAGKKKERHSIKTGNKSAILNIALESLKTSQTYRNDQSFVKVISRLQCSFFFSFGQFALSNPVFSYNFTHAKKREILRIFKDVLLAIVSSSEITIIFVRFRITFIFLLFQMNSRILIA